MQRNIDMIPSEKNINMIFLSLGSAIFERKER